MIHDQHPQIFAAMGIQAPRIGNIGTYWCALDPDGIMVLMGHKNYFKKFQSEPGNPRSATFLKYVEPGGGELTSSSAKESVKRLSDYFLAGNTRMWIIEAEFKEDGSSQEAAKFYRATGKAFHGHVEDFNPANGRTVVRLDGTIRKLKF